MEKLEKLKNFINYWLLGVIIGSIIVSLLDYWNMWCDVWFIINFLAWVVINLIYLKKNKYKL